jgi:hypothetical protein
MSSISSAPNAPRKARRTNAMAGRLNSMNKAPARSRHSSSTAGRRAVRLSFVGAVVAAEAFIRAPARDNPSPVITAPWDGQQGVRSLAHRFASPRDFLTSPLVTHL